MLWFVSLDFVDYEFVNTREHSRCTRLSVWFSTPSSLALGCTVLIPAILRASFEIVIRLFFIRVLTMGASIFCDRLAKVILYTGVSWGLWTNSETGCVFMAPCDALKVLSASTVSSVKRSRRQLQSEGRCSCLSSTSALAYSARSVGSDDCYRWQCLIPCTKESTRQGVRFCGINFCDKARSSITVVNGIFASTATSFREVRIPF